MNKRGVFGPVTLTPEGVKSVGYKWVFVRKRNEHNVVTRYEARLVAQGFIQKSGVDYTETYSPVVDAITLMVHLVRLDSPRQVALSQQCKICLCLAVQNSQQNCVWDPPNSPISWAYHIS